MVTGRLADRTVVDGVGGRHRRPPAADATRLGRVEGLDRKEVLKLVRELVPKLPRQKSHGGRYVYRGVQLRRPTRSTTNRRRDAPRSARRSCQSAASAMSRTPTTALPHRLALPAADSATIGDRRRWAVCRKSARRSTRDLRTSKRGGTRTGICGTSRRRVRCAGLLPHWTPTPAVLPPYVVEYFGGSDKILNEILRVLPANYSGHLSARRSGRSCRGAALAQVSSRDSWVVRQGLRTGSRQHRHTGGGAPSQGAPCSPEMASEIAVVRRHERESEFDDQELGVRTLRRAVNGAGRLGGPMPLALRA